MLRSHASHQMYNTGYRRVGKLLESEGRGRRVWFNYWKYALLKVIQENYSEYKAPGKINYDTCFKLYLKNSF